MNKLKIGYLKNDKKNIYTTKNNKKPQTKNHNKSKTNPNPKHTNPNYTHNFNLTLAPTIHLIKSVENPIDASHFPKYLTQGISISSALLTCS